MESKKSFKKLLLLIWCISVLKCTQEPYKYGIFLPDTSRPVELQFPVGGETFFIGDTVIIRWRVDSKRINGVVPYISIEDGETWGTISPSGVIFCKDSSGDENMEYRWIIGQEYAPERPDYSSSDNNYDKCRIKIEDFKQSGLPYSVSKNFTIKKVRL